MGSTSRTGSAGMISFGLTAPPEPDFPTDILVDPCLEPSPLLGSTPVLQAPPEPELGAGNSFFDVFFLR